MVLQCFGVEVQIEDAQPAKATLLDPRFQQFSLGQDLGHDLARALSRALSGRQS